jgi:hypothetical protein
MTNPLFWYVPDALDHTAVGPGEEPGEPSPPLYFNGLYAGLALFSRPITQQEGLNIIALNRVAQRSDYVQQGILPSSVWAGDETTIVNRGDGLYLTYKGSHRAFAIQAVQNGIVREAISQQIDILQSPNAKIMFQWDATSISISVNGESILRTILENPLTLLSGEVEIGSLAAIQHIDADIGPAYIFPGANINEKDIEFLNGITTVPRPESDPISPRFRSFWRP